jgi:hypothetical protein
MVSSNPYAAPKGPDYAPDYSEQYDPAYAAPTELGPYDRPGDPYASRLQEQIGGVPDPQRLQDAPIRSYRVNPQDQYALWEQLDQPKSGIERAYGRNQRGQWVEDVDPRASLGANRWARNPRETPPSPERVTAQFSPSTYRFERDMTGTTPYRFTGDHASMASMRRDDPQVYGMQPASARRTTQRLDVVSWGSRIVDVAPQTSYPNGEITATAVQSPLSGGGAYRLG